MSHTALYTLVLQISPSECQLLFSLCSDTCTYDASLLGCFLSPTPVLFRSLKLLHFLRLRVEFKYLCIALLLPTSYQLRLN